MADTPTRTVTVCEMDPWRACTVHKVGYREDGACPVGDPR